MHPEPCGLEAYKSYQYSQATPPFQARTGQPSRPGLRTACVPAARSLPNTPGTATPAQHLIHISAPSSNSVSPVTSLLPTPQALLLLQPPGVQDPREALPQRPVHVRPARQRLRRNRPRPPRLGCRTVRVRHPGCTGHDTGAPLHAHFQVRTPARAVVSCQLVRGTVP